MLLKLAKSDFSHLRLPHDGPVYTLEDPAGLVVIEVDREPDEDGEYGVEFLEWPMFVEDGLDFGPDEDDPVLWFEDLEEEVVGFDALIFLGTSSE